MPLLLFAAILLVAGLAYNLAHLDTGGEQIPAAPNSGSPNPSSAGILDPGTAALLLTVTFLGLVIASVVFVLLRQKRIKTRRIVRPTSWADIAATFVAFFIFALLIFLWPRIARTGEQAVSPGNGTGGASNGAAIPAVSGVPLGVFLAVALFTSILVIAIFLRVGTNLRRMAPQGPVRGRRRAAAQAVQATISEIQLGGDVRAAILACYQRFCVLLGQRGIDAQTALTPRELEGLAVTRLAVSSDSAAMLTSLFEEARYSEHALGDPDRDRAVRSLEKIRADVEA